MRTRGSSCPSSRLIPRRVFLQQEEARVAPIVDHHDAGQFGDLKMIQSRYKSERVWQAISGLDETLAGQSVWLRARIHASRSKGKNCFLVVRQGCYSVQACMFASDSIPVEMVKYTGKYVGASTGRPSGPSNELCPDPL